MLCHPLHLHYLHSFLLMRRTRTVALVDGVVDALVSVVASFSAICRCNDAMWWSFSPTRDNAVVSKSRCDDGVAATMLDRCHKRVAD